MRSVTDLMAEGLHLAAIDEPPSACPPNTYDAITGQLITEGYVASALAGAATTEFLDTFRGNPHGYVAVNTARCWRAQNPRGDNRAARSVLAFADGAAWLPMIARETATDERPCWSDLVRRVWPAREGQACVAIVTTDQKKRLWPRARVGPLGAATPVYVYDPSTAQDGATFVRWPIVLAMLDELEVIYSAGLVKPQLAHSLLSALQKPPVPREQLVRWEVRLRRWRTEPEFPLALLIAQKRPETAPLPPSPPARASRRAAPIQGVLL